MDINMNIDWNKITLADFKNNITAIMKITGAIPIGPLPTKDDDRSWTTHFSAQKSFYFFRERFDRGEVKAGIEAFLFAMEIRYRNPSWFERLLHEALLKFDRSEGEERDLAKLLGMKSKQRSGNEYSISKRRSRDFDICFMILEIKTLTGCGVFKCCEVLSC